MSWGVPRPDDTGPGSSPPSWKTEPLVYPAGSRLFCTDALCDRVLATLKREMMPGERVGVDELERVDAAKPIETGGTLDCPEHGPCKLPLRVRVP